MASVVCTGCKRKHPRPAGRRCPFLCGIIDQDKSEYDGSDESDSALTGTAGDTQQQVAADNRPETQETTNNPGTVAFIEKHEELDWWQKSVIYQIYPRSFQDANGDGIGDIKGIISRLDYFVYIGVDAIWLSPVYTSPMKDFGYDVSNFMDIDPIFGTLADMNELIRGAHTRDIKVIMDFIPNHTSDNHPWFIKSKLPTKNEYSDFYIWSGGKTGSDGEQEPPNNWISVFGGPAWTWVDSRKQFYFHQYLKEQPDLNWRNPRVVEEMNNVLTFWLDRGVDGFRIDAMSKLFEEENLTKDEPRSSNVDAKADESRYLEHIYVRHQQGNYDAVSNWRKLFSEYEEKTGRHHVYMVTEMYDRSLKHSMKYYDYGVDYPFNFNLVYIDSKTGGREIYDLVNGWLSKMPDGKWPNWVDRYKQRSRDPSRAPMQWSAEKCAGFTSASQSWLPVHSNYNQCNVEIQKSEPTSTLNIYKQLVKLRHKAAFQKGSMVYNTVNHNIFSFVRCCTAGPRYLVVINFGDHSCTADCSCVLSDISYTKGQVILDTAPSVQKEEVVDLRSLDMEAGQAKVIQLTE